VTPLIFADTDPWTFESWLKWDGDPGGNYIAYAGKRSGAETIMLKYLGNNRFVLRARDNLYYYFTARSSDIIVDEWTHVVWIADGAGNLTIYLDGEFLETRASTPTQMHFNHIGRGEAGNRWAYEGLIGKVLIYNRVLTPEEIENNYLATQGRYD
ncbi:LamG domain-containing protein, partial [Chloroflexota bacterium]